VVRTSWCHGELLAERFPTGSFDLVWAENCVDHSYDPIRVINAAIDVVKVGGWVVMVHAQNEAENEHYDGLHQWNFCERIGAFHIWNQKTDDNVSVLLQSFAEVDCRTENGGVIVAIRKLRERPPENPMVRLRHEIVRAVDPSLEALTSRWPFLKQVLHHLPGRRKSD